MEVTVIGAGRMGTVIAKGLPLDTKKVIIDTVKDKAETLAKIVGGEASDSLDAARHADIIAVALPTPAVHDTVVGLLPLVKKGAVILNMATTAVLPPDLRPRDDETQIIDAKIIGHARSIERGEPSILVVGETDDATFTQIKEQMKAFASVERGDPQIVSRINTIGSTEGIKAAVAIRKQLRSSQIPEAWINVVIRTVCAGTMRSFTEDDLGHFARELVKQLEQ